MMIERENPFQEVPDHLAQSHMANGSCIVKALNNKGAYSIGPSFDSNYVKLCSMTTQYTGQFFT